MTEEITLHQATVDQAFSGIDWGTVAPSTSEDLQFRVFNTSELYTAVNAQVSLPNTSNHYVSTDGKTFAASVTLPDIGPTAHSAVLTLRRITPRAASAGLDGFQITMTVGTWVPAVS